ncbi:MAG: Holliday junction resolvase RuvX [Pseudomonadota bacterium]
MPATPDTTTTLLAFDYGRRRIGSAVGQSITQSASPLGVITNGSNGPDYDHVHALIREWRPNLLVIGQPLFADGSTTPMQAEIDAFVEALAEFDLPVEFVDERHTSQEAEAELKRRRVAGERGRIQKEDIDSAAAVLIAERFLASSG